MNVNSEDDPVEIAILETQNALDRERKTSAATVAKNVLANFCRLGSNWLILLVVPPLLTRSMSEPAYATWMLILQLGAYITILQGGVETAISRFVARADYTEDWASARRIFSASGFCLVVASFMLCVVSIVVCSQMGRFFPDIPSTLMRSAKGALLLVLLLYSLNLPGSLLSGIFQGRQKNEVIAVAATGGRVIASVGVAWSALHDGGLIQMALWIGLGTCAQTLFFAAAWARDPGHVQFRPIQLKLSAIKEFLLFCSSMLVAQLSGLLVTGMDLPIVAAYDFPASGYYAAATMFCNMFTVPYMAILGAFIPVTAGLAATKSSGQLGDVLIQMTRYSTLLLCLGALPLMLGMKLFLTIWLGQGYAEHMLLFASTLIAAQFIRLTMFPYVIVGFGAGQQSRMLVSPLVEGIVNLVCSLIGVRYLGAFGVALGTLIGAIVGVSLHFFNSIPKTDFIFVSRQELFWKGMVSPTGVSVAIFLPLLLLTRISISRVVQVAATIVLLAGLAVAHWNLTLKSKDRSFILGMIDRLSERIRGVAWAA